MCVARAHPLPRAPRLTPPPPLPPSDGVVGEATGSGLTVPSAATMQSFSDALAIAAAADSSVVWASNAMQVFYVGIAGQVIAAAAILVFILFNAVTCLCRCLSPCCVSPFFNFLLALAKLALAVLGVAALATQTNVLGAAITATGSLALSAKAISAVSAAIASGAISANTGALLTAAATATSKSTQAGQIVGALGAAALAVNAALSFLLMIKCGGPAHHPEPKASKPVTTASPV